MLLGRRVGHLAAPEMVRPLWWVACVPGAADPSAGQPPARGSRPECRPVLPVASLGGLGQQLGHHLAGGYWRTDGCGAEAPAGSDVLAGDLLSLQVPGRTGLWSSGSRLECRVLTEPGLEGPRGWELGVGWCKGVSTGLDVWTWGLAHLLVCSDSPLTSPGISVSTWLLFLFS